MIKKATPVELKIFTPLQVALSAFIFGPLAGGIMSGLNYRRYNRSLWIVVLIVPTLIQILALFIFFLFFPKFEIPTYAFPIFSAITYYLYQYRLHSYLPFQKLPESFLSTLLYGFLGSFMLYLPFVLLFGIDQALVVLEILS